MNDTTQIETEQNFVGIFINEECVGRIRQQIIFIDGINKGHLKDGREVIKVNGEWRYEPKYFFVSTSINHLINCGC